MQAYDDSDSDAEQGGDQDKRDYKCEHEQDAGTHQQATRVENGEAPAADKRSGQISPPGDGGGGCVAADGATRTSPLKVRQLQGSQCIRLPWALLACLLYQPWAMLAFLLAVAMLVCEHSTGLTCACASETSAHLAEPWQS